MDILSHLEELLPISPPFALDRVERDEEKAEVHLYLTLPEPVIPEGYGVHSHYPRKWEHLKLFEYRCFIHCNLPIYHHKVTGELKKAEVSFSRDYSRFTLKYEAEVMRLLKIHHCLTKVGKTLGIYPQRVEHIYHHYTTDCQDNELRKVPVRIAYDETSTRKGHEYITTFYDFDTQKIVGIYEGKSSDCVYQFMQDHPYPEAVEELSLDMSPAFIKGARLYFPQARLTFDRWHVVKLLFKHLDNLEEKAAKFHRLIRLVMKDLTVFYKNQNQELFREQLAFIADFAQTQLGDNSITKTIQRYWDGIVNYPLSKVNNGVLEGINSKIQVIKRVARGFRSKQNFMKMIRFVFDKEQVQVIS